MTVFLKIALKVVKLYDSQDIRNKKSKNGKNFFSENSNFLLILDN